MRSGLISIVMFMLLLITACPEAQEATDIPTPQDEATVVYDPDAALSERAEIDGVVIMFAPADAVLAETLGPVIKEQVSKVEEFFGEPFAAPYVVRIFPDRAALDHHWASTWGGEGFRGQCWMVASGVADELAMLSPRMWKEQACEHDSDDPIHVARIIAHELAHVYHGQRYTTPDFEGMDDLGWFAEGVAVLVSGQLDDERRAQAKEAIEAGVALTQLEDAWSGQYRYAVGGTLAEFVYQRLGREGLLAALSYEKLPELLEALKMSADEVLAAWKKSMIG